MPTVITHAAVLLCIGLGLGSKAIPPRLLFAGIILAMLPDADVLSFKFGVAYGNVFGHRGFTHSLVFAFIVECHVSAILIMLMWESFPHQRGEEEAIPSIPYFFR